MPAEKPARPTPMQPEQVFLALASAWQLVTQTPPDRKIIHILHAQSALETGHWRSMMNHNLGGIKRLGTCDWTYFTTGEDVPDASAQQKLASSKPGAEVVMVSQKNGITHLRYSGKQPTTCFASWDDLDSGAQGYIRFITTKAPKAIEAAKNGDAKGYVHELKRVGYFSAPEDVYARDVDSIARSYTKKLQDVQLPTVVML